MSNAYAFLALLLLATTVRAELVDPTRPPVFNPASGNTPLTEDTRSGPKLSSILLAKDRSFAVINGKPVRVGDPVGDLTVFAIYKNQVELRGAGGPVLLTLYDPKPIKQAAEDHE